MYINYYGIENCIPDTYNGAPVLIAPAGTEPALLQSRGFQQLPDGRFAHLLSQAEYQFLQGCDQSKPIIFGNPATAAAPQPAAKRHDGNPLALTSLVLMLVRLALVGSVFSETAQETGSKILTGFGSLCGLAAWVLIIITRVKYPQNTLGKVLFIIYIVMYVLALIAVIAVGIMCAVACNSCISDCHID